MILISCRPTRSSPAPYEPMQCTLRRTNQKRGALPCSLARRSLLLPWNRAMQRGHAKNNGRTSRYQAVQWTCSSPNMPTFVLLLQVSVSHPKPTLHRGRRTRLSGWPRTEQLPWTTSARGRAAAVACFYSGLLYDGAGAGKVSRWQLQSRDRSVRVSQALCRATVLGAISLEVGLNGCNTQLINSVRMRVGSGSRRILSLLSGGEGWKSSRRVGNSAELYWGCAMGVKHARCRRGVVA